MQERSRCHSRGLLLCCAILIQSLLLGAPAWTHAAGPTYQVIPDRGFCAITNPTVTARSGGFTPGMLVLFQFRWSHHFPLPPPRGGHLTEQVVKPDGTLATQLTLEACGPDVPDGSVMTISLDEYFGSSHLSVPRTGQHLATITFTVDRSGPALPGLPNTGQGVSAATMVSPIRATAFGALLFIAMLTTRRLRSRE
jgi:hypothetical protein